MFWMTQQSDILKIERQKEYLCFHSEYEIKFRCHTLADEILPIYSAQLFKTVVSWKYYILIFQTVSLWSTLIFFILELESIYSHNSENLNWLIVFPWYGYVTIWNISIIPFINIDIAIKLLQQFYVQYYFLQVALHAVLEIQLHLLSAWTHRMKVMLTVLEIVWSFPYYMSMPFIEAVSRELASQGWQIVLLVTNTMVYFGWAIYFWGAESVMVKVYGFSYDLTTSIANTYFTVAILLLKLAVAAIRYESEISLITVSIKEC